jgi:hypothetical protein
MLAQAKTNTEKATSAPTVPKVPKSQPEAKARHRTFHGCHFQNVQRLKGFIKGLPPPAADPGH